MKPKYILKQKAAEITDLTHTSYGNLIGVIRFRMETKFFPLQTVVIDLDADKDYYGYLNDIPLYEKNLMKIFEKYVSIDTLLQGVQQIDLSQVMLSAGELKPEILPDLTGNKRYVLFYLEENN